ncbi:MULTISPECIES: RT0821/Lpp0805 family surface protein [Rhizobium]|uniref:RT0821/Lpp0805 family surface protein n=1 Tax=Rhizobium sp. AC27/96 TaxID=1841653 RepID=UPI001FCDE74A|nr:MULTISPECIES: RT0821/Lpp0805 family surface protein [Rhizobium]
MTTAVALVSFFTLGGCVGGGMDYLSSAKVDRSVSTGTVPTAPVTTDSISDETTVRNAVTSADLQKLNGQTIPWANASTGSAGVIDTIVESNGSGVVCRQFRTTRHSYEGIASFSGRTCLVGQGIWQLLSFQQAG